MAVRNGVATRGTSNGNDRGSAETRRRRKIWLIETYRSNITAIKVTYADKPMPHLATCLIGKTEIIFPEPEGFNGAWSIRVNVQQIHGYITSVEALPTCRCYRCGKPLTFETLTVDRILPGCKGGTYRRTNIRPACAGCNSETGGGLSRGKEHQKAKKAASKRRTAKRDPVAA